MLHISYCGLKAIGGSENAELLGGGKEEHCLGQGSMGGRLLRTCLPLQHGLLATASARLLS